MDEKEEKGEPGLHLTDKTIHRISGPASMYYLKPKTTKSFNGVRENLPLVLLWGDIHQDDQGMCENCTCSDSCCYPIYDKEFLKELDKLASNYPVDFYTETSADMPQMEVMDNPKNILFHRFLLKTTIECHKKVERSTSHYKNTCPTENIRWHYSDPRFMKNSMEHYGLYLSEFMMENTHYVLKDLEQELETVDDVADNTIQEKIIDTINNYHLLLFMGDVDNQYRPAPDSNNYPAYRAGWDFFLDISRYITYSKDISIIKDVIHIYVDHIIRNDKYSAIYKQFKKFSPQISYSKLVHFLDNIYSLLIPEASIYAISILWILNSHPRIRDFFQDFFRSDYLNSNKFLKFQSITKEEISVIIRVLHLLSEVIFHIAIITVELYTLFRMLKPPQGSSSPFLVMGFYGDAHTQNMVKILQSSFFNYEIAHQSETGDRCMTINTPVYLARDLEERAQTILSYPAHRSAYENYKRVIEAERKGRQPALRNASSNGPKKSLKAKKPSSSPHTNNFLKVNRFLSSFRKKGGTRKRRSKQKAL